METLYGVVDNAIGFVYSLKPYAEPTVVLVPAAVDGYVSSIAQSTGLDPGELQQVLSFLVCFPLGLIMSMLPYGKIRHLFSFLLGAFLLQFTVRVEWIHILVSSLFGYILLLLLPTNMLKTVMPAFALIYISGAHIHRQYTNYLGWDMDFTSAQMVITVKLWTIAFNVYDGRMLAAGTADRASKKCADVAVAEVPSILEYFGYMFCFSTVLAGPCFEFKTYQRGCDGTNLYDKNGKALGKIPSNFWPSLKPFLVGLACLGFFVVGSAQFPILNQSDSISGVPYVLSEEMLSKSIFYRVGYSILALTFTRYSYIFAWKMAEGATNLWYCGFEGFDDEGNSKGWEVSNNMDIVAFETGTSMQAISTVWNKKSSVWLTRYIYIRTNGSLVATYMTSAFWHGFYPGYYLFFLSVPIASMAERQFKKKLSPTFNKLGVVYTLLSFCYVTALKSYLVMPFKLLSFDRSFEYYKSQFFLHHVISIVAFAVLSLIPSPKKEKKT